MRRLKLAAALAAAALFAAALAVPALGGPSISQIAKSAAKALKIAKSADKRSKQALALAKKVAVQNGVNGTNGTNGSPGAPGPPGPPGPSGAAKIDFRADPGTPDTTVLSFDGLVIKARCDAGPNLTVNATSTVDGSELHVEGIKGPNGVATPVYTENDHLGPGSSLSLPATNFQGTLTFSTPAGAVVTATLGAEQSAFNGSKGCWLGGWALHDPS